MALQWRYRIGLGWQPLVATVRAVVQLAVIALVLQGVFEAPWTAVFVIATMLVIASLTAARRLSMLNYGRQAAIIGVVTGGTITTLAIFALQLVSVEVRYVIAISGIVIGNSMSGVTLAGRNFYRACLARRGEIEGWLALGARPQRAYMDVARESVRESLIPNLDQTKSTGLVTLPGAFVGALFGGASPIEAARFQLVVLVGIMFAMTVASLVTTWRLSTSTTVPVSENEEQASAAGSSDGLKESDSNGSDSHETDPRERAREEEKLLAARGRERVTSQDQEQSTDRDGAGDEETGDTGASGSTRT